MKIFISWSQSDTQKIASILKKELETFFNDEIEFWVSANDISTGGIGINAIVQSLQESEMVITCIDSNNYKNPWLYFETGAVFGRKYNASEERSVTFPIIFDELTIDDFSHTPFGSLQLMKFDKPQFNNMLKRINHQYELLEGKKLLSDKLLQAQFENIWNKIHNSVNNIIAQRKNGVDSVLNAENVVEKLKKYPSFPEAKPGKTIKYSSGFETLIFYKFLLENVKEKLYIFGRKNKKIASNDLIREFHKILENDIDFRMLYIHPDAEDVIKNMAQDTRDFRLKLITSIKTITERFDDQYRIEKYCKAYKERRMSEIIIADNVVFFKDLGYTKDGKPAHFTDGSFNVVSVDSKIGSHYYKMFLDSWNNSEELTENYIDKLK